MKAHLAESTVVTVGAPEPIVPATIYLFELGHVLPRLGNSSLASPQRLRAICEKHVRSIIGSSDLLMFGEDGSFHLVIMSCSGAATAGLASFVNTSLLMLLFGTDQLTPEQNVRLYREVSGAAVPGVATPRMSQLKALIADHANDEHPPEDIDGRGNDSLVDLAGRGVFPEQGVELQFFPVHDLRRQAVSALFCAPTFAGAVFGHQAFSNLSPSLLPYVDRAILLHSLAFARRIAAAGIVVAVGAPVSFETLAWSRSREIYQRALRAADVANYAQIILKLEDIPPGTPSERIAQVVSSLRPFARHIFVHLPNSAVRLTMTGRMGASGLVLSLQRRAALPEVLADSKWLSRAAVAQGAMSCIDHVESDEALAMVRSAGIRFAVGNVFGAETVRGTVPVDEVREMLARTEQATVAHLH